MANTFRPDMVQYITFVTDHSLISAPLWPASAPCEAEHFGILNFVEQIHVGISAGKLSDFGFSYFGDAASRRETVAGKASRFLMAEYHTLTSVLPIRIKATHNPIHIPNAPSLDLKQRNAPSGKPINQ